MTAAAPENIACKADGSAATSARELRQHSVRWEKRDDPAPILPAQFTPSGATVDGSSIFTPPIQHFGSKPFGWVVFTGRESDEIPARGCERLERESGADTTADSLAESGSRVVATPMLKRSDRPTGFILEQQRTHPQGGAMPVARSLPLSFTLSGPDRGSQTGQGKPI